MKKGSKKVALVLAVALTAGVALPTVAPRAQASDYIGGGTTQPGYKILSTHYISQANVKSMASTIRATTGGPGILGAALVSLLGPMGFATSIAYALSANAQSQSEVLYAADHNMRLKVVTKDKAPYTSYSKVVEYTAVP